MLNPCWLRDDIKAIDLMQTHVRSVTPKVPASFLTGSILSMRFSLSLNILCVTLATLCVPGILHAESAPVAVAANFIHTATLLARQYEEVSGHRVSLSSASTGVLVSQIENGAPFTALLAADSERPRYLEDYELAVLDTRFTYAIGKLALASVTDKLPGPAMLRAGRYQTLGIANPLLAPYGQAAQTTLLRMGLWTVAKPKLITSPNVSQTFQQVTSGALSAGFVGLSQALRYGRQDTIYFWPVPSHYHDPIEQQAVLLEPGRFNAAAKGFLDYLKSEKGRRVITGDGYLVPVD